MKLSEALNKKGSRWLNTNCPFHKDETASSGYLPNAQAFNCFSCGKKIVGKEKILNEINNIGFIEDRPSNFTINSNPYVIADVSLKIAIENDLDFKSFETEKKMLINSEVEKTNIYLGWLSERGIELKTIEAFNGWFCIEPGKLYNHLVFPYKNGKSIVARNFGDGDRFHNIGNKNLFNQSCLEHNEQIFLVEGLSDFLAMYQMGFNNTVTGFGVALNSKLLYPLRGKTVYILFDTDFAGFEGSKKAFELLRELEAIPIILNIPKQFNHNTDKTDVGDAYAKHRDVFKYWIQTSVSKFSDFDNNEVERFIKGEMPPTKYITTGLEEFDNTMRGGFATGLHVVGGEPESGKSTLITHWMDTSICNGSKVLVATYELSKQQMFARLASRYTNKASWQDIEREPNILQTTETKASKALQILSNSLKIVVDWDINHILASAHLFDVLMIDYAQRMPSVIKGESSRDGLIYNVNKLSDLCRKQGKIIILISSIPRSSYGNDTFERNVFKESGVFEYVSVSAHVIKRMSKGYAQLRTVKCTRGLTATTTFVKIKSDHQQVLQASAEQILGS